VAFEGKELVQVHSIPNWSGVTDCVVLREYIPSGEDEIVSRTVDPLALSFPDEARHRLFISCGNGEQGSIKELRMGYRTTVTVEMELEQYSPT
jgi:Mono-functional DNA-alkylating methyl methanesulfonate N-term